MRLYTLAVRCDWASKWVKTEICILRPDEQTQNTRNDV